MSTPVRNLLHRWGGSRNAGRNSSGRITSFHRGGGSKRLQRVIDLKRSTASMGIVERIEYDPNRSSRIALVRWIGGRIQQLGRYQRKCNTAVEELAPPPRKIFEPATICGSFSLSTLQAGKLDQSLALPLSRPVSPGLTAACAVVGLPTRSMPPWSAAGSKKTCSKDVFFSALSSTNAKGSETDPISFCSGFPRIAVAGAKPTFFAPRMREKDVRGGKNTFPLCEIRKWRPDSNLWAHRMKRKAAISWHSLRARQETDGRLVGGAAQHHESKPKTRGKEGPKVDRAPVTYIIASHQLEAGKMVMNCDWSKPSAAQNAYTS